MNAKTTFWDAFLEAMQGPLKVHPYTIGAKSLRNLLKKDVSAHRSESPSFCGLWAPRGARVSQKYKEPPNAPQKLQGAQGNASKPQKLQEAPGGARKP